MQKCLTAVGVVFRLTREIASDAFSSHLTVDWNLTALFAARFCGA